MFRHHQHTNPSAVLSLFLACLLLAMAPFAAALEIHHELAPADHDGHEHSDSDLCQWVQYHTGHSLTGDVPTPCSLLTEAPLQMARAPVFTSQSVPVSRASRAPPLI